MILITKQKNTKELDTMRKHLDELKLELKLIKKEEIKNSVVIESIRTKSKKLEDENNFLKQKIESQNNDYNIQILQLEMKLKNSNIYNTAKNTTFKKLEDNYNLY